MSAEAWLRAFNARDLGALLALYADDAVHWSPNLRAKKPETGGRISGKSALRAWWEEAFRTLPGLRYESPVITDGGDRVWIEYDRVLPGEPTRKVAELLVLLGGKIVESRVFNG